MRGVLLASVASALLAGCAIERPSLPPLTGTAAIGRPLTLALPLYPDGKPHDLAEDEGKVVFLDVWATWCEPCKDALPVIQDLAKQYAKQGLVVYAVNTDADRRDVDKFIKEMNVTVPVLLDKDGRAAAQILKVEQLPMSFLIDRRGVLRKTHVGWDGAFLQRDQNEIEELLREP